MLKKYKKNFIILHHSLTEAKSTTFEAVDRHHQKKYNFLSSLGFNCGYHYFIDAQGVVTEARADWEAGAHCLEAGKNFDSLGICLAGNFDLEKPTEAQRQALRILILLKMAKHGIKFENLKLHRDYAEYKSCPGKNIKEDFFSALLKFNY